MGLLQTVRLISMERIGRGAYKLSGELGVSDSNQISCCFECQGTRIITDNILGEYYCEECGLIIEDNMFDLSAYTRTSQGVDDAPAPTTKFTKVNKGLGTIFNITNDLKSLIYTFRRLKQIHERRGENNKDERSFDRALPYLKNVWSRLSLPNYVIDSSAIIYRKCIRKGLIRGKRREGIALAAIQYACLKEGFDADVSIIANDFGITAEKLSEYVEIIKNTKTISRRPTVHEYMLGIMNTLDLPTETRIRAVNIFKHVAARRLEIGHHPGAVAAAIVWCATNMGDGKKVSQNEVANLTNVSQTTVKRFVSLIRSV